MRKKTLLLSLLLLPLIPITSIAQDKQSGVPSIKVATSGAQNEGRLISFSVYTQQKGFYVDFGNGNTREYPWAGTVAFSDRTYGDTIKIYSLSADDPIQTFSCKEDSITGIVLNCPTLKLLDFSDNLLTDIDLSGTPNLQKIFAARNSLVKFKYPEGKDLTYLDVSQNKLEAIDVSNSLKLEYLDASVNNMRAPLSLKWSESPLMKHFDVSCNNFFNLDNIPAYPNLEYLAFNHNKIQVVDLSKYPKLQTLKMQYNTGMSSAELSRCPDLTYLDATGTAIINLDLKNNKKLETLKASLLKLTNFDVSCCPELKNLSVEKAGLTELDLSSNAKLKSLDIAGNEISQLDVSKNKTLTNLDCRNNKLTALNVGELSMLDTLNCSINYIEVLDITKSVALKSLNCSSNAISELNIKNNKNIVYMNCSDNKIENLTFSAQLDLAGASVSGNKMSKEALETMFTSLPDINGIEIKPEDALWKGLLTYSNNPGSEAADATTLEAKGWKSQVSADAIGNASAMAVFNPDMVGTKVAFALDCAGDISIDWGDGNKKFYKYTPKYGSYQNMEDVLKSTTIKIYAPETTDFGIANTSVSQINVSNMPKLKFFACSGNAITELDLSKNEELEQLTCSNNPLVFLNLGKAKSLKNLYCENTQIKDLDFSNCKNLKYLDLQKNRLATLNLTGCDALETIDATYNDLTEVNLTTSPLLTTFFADKNKLKHLDLTKNTALQNLSVGVNELDLLDLSSLKDLVYIYCNDNKIKDLQIESNKVKVLQAQNNELSSIKMTNCPNLTVLALNNNQLSSVDLSTSKILQRLWLNDNKLESIIFPEGGLPKVGVFNASNNLLESFDFSVVPWATEIAISGNKISGDVDLSSCGALDKFFGSDNKIESIKFSGSALTTLIVNNNKLKSLNIPSGGLYWLEAKDNELVAVNVSATGNLYMLNLDNNKINSLNLSGKNKIVSVSLRNNAFESNALDRIYEQLPDITGTVPSSDYGSWMTWVFVEGNPGAEAADYSILTNKGWNVDVKGTSSIKQTTEEKSFSYDKATGNITFFGNNAKNIRIISLSGTVTDIDANDGMINISNLPKGIYVISIDIDGKKYTEKIIK